MPLITTTKRYGYVIPHSPSNMHRILAYKHCTDLKLLFTSVNSDLSSVRVKTVRGVICIILSINVPKYFQSNLVYNIHNLVLYSLRIFKTHTSFICARKVKIKLTHYNSY